MMTKGKLVLPALALALSTLTPARAQVSVDIAKITCEQFLLFQVADPQHIAIWIHGFYSGKRDNTVIDVQVLKASADKVRDYCRANMGKPVFQAVETIFGPPK